MTRLLLAVPALFAVAALAGAVGPPSPARGDTPVAADTITVTGTGSVSAAPDDAQLSFGVDSRGETAQAALAANGDAMRKVISALRAAGARDLATQWVSVWHSDDEGTTSGYSASNSVSATIGVARAGELIDTAVAAGANQVSGPDMSAADTKRLYQQALGNAVDDARAHAEALAKATGRTLGSVTAIAEGGGAEPMPMYRAAADAASPTPIVGGQQETTATVTVTFALR